MQGTNGRGPERRGSSTLRTVSADEQARSGFSPAQHIDASGEYAAYEGMGP